MGKLEEYEVMKVRDRFLFPMLDAYLRQLAAYLVGHQAQDELRTP